MSNFLYASVRFAIIVLFLISAAGCEEQTSTVKGVVTLDNKPLFVSKGARGTVVFEPATGHRAPLNANIGAEGQFELAVGSKRTAHPGAYRVAVSVVEIIGPTAENPEPTGRRLTAPKYASVETSGLEISIGPGENDVMIPLVSETESSSAP